MANPKDVAHLLSELHNSKIINLDSPIRHVLEQSALNNLSPGVSVASAVVAWDGYGLVIKGAAPDLNQIQSVANSIAGKVNG